MFQVKQRDWWQGVQDPATQWGQVSKPHFWTLAGGCLLLFGTDADAGLPLKEVTSGLANPASSQRLDSTDLVTLLWRTIHWTALTWKPLPPQVCEHFDQGVRSHSNFKLSAFPTKSKRKTNTCTSLFFKRFMTKKKKNTAWKKPRNNSLSRK